MEECCPDCLADEPYGYEIPEVYDGILFWVCRSCGLSWPRFTTGRLASASRAAVDAYNRPRY